MSNEEAIIQKVVEMPDTGNMIGQEVDRVDSPNQRIYDNVSSSYAPEAKTSIGNKIFLMSYITKSLYIYNSMLVK